MEEKQVNLCAMIPASLHVRVLEEQGRSGMKRGEYIAMLITEYYKMKEGATMQDKDTKTLAVQIPADLFDALDEYIARHHIKSKKELITSLIRKLLEENASGAGAEADA